MSNPTGQPGSIDWGQGDYESTAAELAPVAAHVVRLAGVAPGEPLLDLATGTGNAALAAARAGAVVTGIDASPRLIEVARHRAAAERLEATFRVGDLHELPFASASFSCVLSVFGLIFAGDPQRAVAELLRVLTADGRALISVWVPAGPIDAMVGVFMRAVAEALGARPPRFPWHDPPAVAGLLSGHRVELGCHDGMLPISAGSAEEYLERQRSHPMSVAIAPVLDAAGTARATYEEALAVLRAANESGDAFRVTSPYRVIEIRRQA